MLRDLRAELVGAKDDRPELVLLLPDGWVLRRGDASQFQQEAEAAVAALPADVRTALGPGVRTLVAKAAAAARTARGDLVGVIRQEDVPIERYVPMSLALSWIRPPTGATVRRLGEQLIATKGAAPMAGSPGVLRWIEQERVTADGGSGDFGGPCYLVPVHDDVQAALLARTTLPMPDDPDEQMQQWRDALFLLGDSMVATIRWRRDAADARG